MTETSERSEQDLQQLQLLLLVAIIDELLVPLMLSTALESDALMNLIKHRMIEEMRQRHGASLRTTARHLGVTARTVSNYQSSEIDNTLLELLARYDSPRQGVEQADWRWVDVVMATVHSAWPGSLSAQQVRRRLLDQGFTITIPGAEKLLDLYVELDMLERMEPDREAGARLVRYRTRHTVGARSRGICEDGLARLRRHLPLALPLLRSVLKNDLGAASGSVVALLDESLLEACDGEITEATTRIVRNYVDLSRELDAAGASKLIPWGHFVLKGCIPERYLARGQDDDKEESEE